MPSLSPPAGVASDPYGSESADCGYDGIKVLDAELRCEREQRMAERERREDEDYNDGYEQMLERVLHNDGRRSYFYGRPAADLPVEACVYSV